MLLVGSCAFASGNPTGIGTDGEPSYVPEAVVEMSADDVKRITGIVDFVSAQTAPNPIDRVDHLLNALMADPEAGLPLQQLLFLFNQAEVLKHGLPRLRNIAANHPTALMVNLSALMLSPPDERDKAIATAERCVKHSRTAEFNDRQWRVFASMIGVLARLYATAGEFERGDALLNEVLYETAGKAPSELAAAVALFYAEAIRNGGGNIDHYRERQSHYLDIVESADFDPANRKQLAERVVFYEQMERFDAAETLLLNQLSRQPMDISLRLMLGEFYFRQRRFYPATMVWQSVTRDFRPQPIVYLNLGRAAWQAGLTQIADDALRHFLDAGFAPRDAGYLPALVLLERDSPEEALTFLEKLPETVNSLRLRASALGRLGRYRDALDLMLKAAGEYETTDVSNVEYDRFFYLYLLFLGEKCRDRDAVVNAGDYLLKNLDRFEGDPEIANAIGYTFSVISYRLERAESLIAKALDKAPDNAEYLDSMAWVLFRKNDLAGAEKYIRKSLAHSGRYPYAVIADHAGDIFMAAGKTDEALKYWRLALSIYCDEIDRDELAEKIRGATSAL